LFHFFVFCNNIFFLQSKVASLASNPNVEEHIFKWQGDPVILPGTGFPLRRLLRLPGLRWRYSNPIFQHYAFCWCPSQGPRGLRHELCSPARTLESWVRIPLEAWMFVLPCVGSGLATVLSPVQGVLLTVWNQETEKVARAQQKAIVSLIDRWTDGRTEGRMDGWIALFICIFFLYPVFVSFLCPDAVVDLETGGIVCKANCNFQHKCHKFKS
jgi:hypothetical protein